MKTGQFLYNDGEFQEVIEKMKEIKEEMKDLYKEAKKIESTIKGYDGWAGKQKEELLAFLDLIKQFHNDLGSRKENPTSKGYKLVKEMDKKVKNYKNNAKSYKELNGGW